MQVTLGRVLEVAFTIEGLFLIVRGNNHRDHCAELYRRRIRIIICVLRIMYIIRCLTVCTVNVVGHSSIFLKYNFSSAYILCLRAWPVSRCKNSLFFHVLHLLYIIPLSPRQRSYNSETSLVHMYARVIKIGTWDSISPVVLCTHIYVYAHRHTSSSAPNKRIRERLFDIIWHTFARCCTSRSLARLCSIYYIVYSIMYLRLT